MDSVTSYIIAFLFALLVHGLVIALMMFNWGGDTRHQFNQIEPYYIEASVVAENPFTAKQQREHNRQVNYRAQKIHQRREHERNLIRDQERWEAEQLKKQQKVAVTEPAPPPVQSSVTQSSAVADPEPEVDQEAVRSQFEEDLALAMVDETNMRKAVTDDEKAMAYVAQIQREIIQNWSRPPSARNGMETLLRVHLVPTGEIIDVKVIEGSGNDAFDRSAILAVRKSERFVVPADTLRFERDFREFTVLFRPDDLRL
ncbi:MAG: energy transducer TonB [Pseudomonadales bacterium]